MDQEFLSLFDICSDAVIAFREHTAIYANGHAVGLFGASPVGKKDAELFPEALPEHIDQDLVFSSVVAGTEVSVTCRAQSGLLLLTLHAAYDASREEKLSVAMRNELANCLGNIQMSSALLRPYLDQGNNHISTLSAMLTHNCYRLNRLTAHLSILSDQWLTPAADADDYFDLGEVLEAVVHSTDIIAGSDVCRLVCHIPDKPIYFTGSGIPMEIIIMNLLSNGIKYTPKDGTVTATLREGRDNILLQIQDTGVGIAPERLPTVFQGYLEPFDLKDSVRGAGMGLAVSKRLCEIMGGSILVESREGKGTTVTVSLPKPLQKNLVYSDRKLLSPGQASILTEMADIFPHTSYTEKFLD